MASAYGNVVQHWQAYVNAYIVNQTATQATVRCECYFHSIGWGYAVRATGTATANGQSASGTKNASSGYGQTVNQLFATKDVTVSKNGSGFNVYCKATVQVTGGYHNGTSAAGVNVWVPAIAYSAPPKPSNLKVERISDTQQRLTWVNGSGGTTNPVTGANVYRHTDGSDSYDTIYSGSAINAHTDGSTAAGHKYTYDVRNTGPGGTSDMSNAATVYTSPLAPGPVSVTKTDSGVLLTPSSMPAYYDAVETERSADSGKTWEAVACSESGDGYLDPKPPAGAVIYRMRCSIEGLAGAWAETEVVTTVCPPNAPTLGALANVYATGGSVAVTWAPNHPDWSNQSAAQVEVTRDGAATVYDVAGDTAAYGLSDLENGSYTVRVRTKGQDPDWGAWSAYVSFTVAAPPAVSITSPVAGAVVDMLPISVAWAASDETGITAQALTLTAPDGSVIASLKPSAGERSASFGTGYDIRNKSGYTIALRVRGGSGLYAEAACEITTDWKRPDAPTVFLQPGGNKGMSIGIAAAQTEPLAVSFDVVRVLPDGARKTLATGVNDGASIFDSLPPLNTEFGYEVTSYAESGALLKMTHAAIVNSDSVAFNFGADASKSWLGRLDPDWSRKVSHQVDTYHFFNGSELPTAWALGETDVSDSYSFSVLEDGFKEADAISRKYYEGWVRDLYGERYFAALEFSTQRRAPGQWTVNVSATRVAWEEPNG